MNDKAAFLGCVMWIASAVVSVVLKEPFVMVPPVIGMLFLFLASIKE